MPSKKILALLVLGTLGMATWAGYRGECRVMDSAGNKPLTFQSVVRRVTAPRSRTEKVDKLNEIRHRAGRTQISDGDARAAWAMIRGLTVEDLKACLDEIPLEPPRNVNRALLHMLFFRWGQLDPQAAAEAASQAPYQGDSNLIQCVVTAWLDRDPEAAARWSVKLVAGEAKSMIGSIAGKMLVRENPDTALERALVEFPETLDSVVVALATRQGDSEESRRVILLRLASLPDSQALKSYLDVLEWRARRDPEFADSFKAELDRLGLPAEQLAGIKANVSPERQRYEPTEVPQRSRPPGVDSSEPLAAQLSSYTYWCDSDPQKALAWVEQNGRTDLLGETVKRQAMILLRSNWQPGVRQAQRRPLVGQVMQQYASWRKLDSSAAESWLETMPADLRKQLSQATTADATR